MWYLRHDPRIRGNDRTTCRSYISGAHLILLHVFASNIRHLSSVFQIYDLHFFCRIRYSSRRGIAILKLPLLYEVHLHFMYDKDQKWPNNIFKGHLRNSWSFQGPSKMYVLNYTMLSSASRNSHNRSMCEIHRLGYHMSIYISRECILYKYEALIIWKL